jgi:hypothetical protein
MIGLAEPGPNLAPSLVPAEVPPPQDESGPLSIDRLRKQFLTYQSVKDAERWEARRARRYYHKVMWTAEELRELRRRGQPPLTKPYLPRAINGVIGVLERMRQDPKAYPRHPKNDKGASIATATLNYVLDAEGWEEISAESARNGAIEGIGGVELTLVRGDAGDPDVGLAIVDPDTVFYDPRSFRADFSDALYLGICKWMDAEIVAEMFPDQADKIRSLRSRGLDAELFSDREYKWYDADSDTVVLVYHLYYANGDWWWTFYAADVELLSGKSFLIDEKGRTRPNVILYSAYVDHEGDRYGFVRELRSDQDEINQRASKALFIANSRRIIADKNAVDDVERARQEFARADGWIEKNPGAELRRDDQAFDYSSNIKLMEDAKESIQAFAPNNALAGMDGIKSGRAMALAQRAGLANIGPYLIAYRGWKLRVYRAIWNLIQRYWVGERWIRVTDDSDVAQFIQLNGLTLDELGRPQIVNHLGSLDVDIKIDEGPDNVTVYTEAYEMLKGVAGVPPDILLEIAPLQTDVKQRILERMRQPNPLKQQVAMLEIESKRADVGGKKTKALKQLADTFASLAKANATIADLQRPEALPPIANPDAMPPPGVMANALAGAAPMPQMPPGQLPGQPPIPGRFSIRNVPQMPPAGLP